MQYKGAKLLIETLCDLGVDTIFGYPGGAVLDIYDELYLNAHRIRHILSAHEQGAAHAADGYARVTGKPGVVISTSGPGATNLVTGIANAYLDSVPLVAITGNVGVSLLGKDSFQEVDIVGITQPIVKHNYIVRDAAQLEHTIREAFQIATSGRPGPVLVDIPKSVQTQAAVYKGFSEAKPKPANPMPDLTEAAEAICAAKRPYIYLGGGVISGGAEKEALEFARRISAPIGLSIMGLACIPYNEPLNLGMCGMHGHYASTVAQSKADLLIACGVRFSDRATGNVDKYRANCRVIHIDIDRAELGKNVVPDICLQGDVKAILTGLLARLQPQQNPEWLAEIEALKQHLPPPPADTFTPQNIIRAVRRHMPQDAVIATDVGQHQMWVAQHYPFTQTRTFLTSGGLGTMGYGLGAAIGGCIGSGRRRTVHFTSDGSFGMNLNELATAVSQNLPIVTVILNNGVLGMVRQWQTIFYQQHYSHTTLCRQTDFVKLAEAFGAQGVRVTCIRELNAALESSPDSPLVLDCLIDMDECVFPMIPPGGCVEDIRIH
ncbi:MAG: biosynthetic-type acetolactate synthase large subunit [Oscillospiraceae bacterium]|jgi:acetolactate synthase-1/2/3 large subunit|nr:biosynthetic-type acetolactate synthase large subunit [Oscillospiraceae bacterium]